MTIMSHNISMPDIGVGCVFQLQKYNSAGILCTTPRFHNVVLNSGLDLLVSNDVGDFDCCNLGTGAGLESVHDTGLTDFLVSSTDIVEYYDGYSSGIGYDYPALKWWRRKFNYDIGSINSGVSEIGLSLSPNTSYLNRHRVVGPSGLNSGLYVQPNEGLTVWADLYLFATVTVNDTGEGVFLFDSVSGNVYIDYTWQFLSGWLTADEFIPGRINPADIRIVKVPTSNYGEGTPATNIRNPYVDGTFYRDVVAVWDPGYLDGEYWGILIQNGAGTYHRIDFETSITMDPVAYPYVALELRINRDWGRTLREGAWI